MNRTIYNLRATLNAKEIHKKKNRKFPKIKRALVLWHSLDLWTLINSIIAAYLPCCPTVELRLRGMTLISRRNELISTKLVYSLHREENCLFTTMLWWFNPAQKFLNREHLGIHDFFFQTWELDSLFNPCINISIYLKLILIGKVVIFFFFLSI